MPKTAVLLEPGTRVKVKGWRGTFTIDRHRPDEGEVDVWGPLAAESQGLRAVPIARLRAVRRRNRPRKSMAA